MKLKLKKKLKKRKYLFFLIICIIIGGFIMYQVLAPQEEFNIKNLLQSQLKPISDFLTINQVRPELDYLGTYEVISQTNNESLYDVEFITIPVLVDSYIDNETKENITTYREDTQICIRSDFETQEVNYTLSNSNYTVPETLSLYKGKVNALISNKDRDISREIVKANALSLTPNDFEDGDNYTFCYQANPEEDFYLKFGENSIVIIQESQAVSDALLTNVTAETGVRNFTHLNISTTAPYDDLIGYWNFDSFL